MRFATFVFLTIFLFQTSTAYAVLPAAGVIAGGARAGSLVIKGGTKTVLTTGAGAVGGIIGDRLQKWCKTNKKACKDKIGDLYDAFFPDDDNEEEFDGCRIFYAYAVVRDTKPHLDSLSDLYGRAGYKRSESEAIAKAREYHEQKYKSSPSVKFEVRQEIYTEFTDARRQHAKQRCKLVDVGKYYVFMSTLSKKYPGDDVATYVVLTKVRDKDESDEQRKQDIINALRDKLDDDEFTNIINNYGDKNDFDFVFNNCTGDNSCIEIDKEFVDKINNKDYDTNKMNKDNCEVKNNKIVSCDNAKRKKDDDDDKDDKDKKDKDDKKKKDKDDDDKNGNKQPATHRHDDDDDDKILKCDSSEFYKKICDWIDWTQDKEEFKDDSEVDVDDLSKKLKLDDDKIKFNRACPSGQTVRISFGSIIISHNISYDGLCQAFSKMRPFVVGIGFVVGGMIIGGRRV